MKKFEEGIFSDLRNLKPGVDASLEEPKVSFSSYDMSQGFPLPRHPRRRASCLRF